MLLSLGIAYSFSLLHGCDESQTGPRYSHDQRKPSAALIPPSRAAIPLQIAAFLFNRDASDKADWIPITSTCAPKMCISGLSLIDATGGTLIFGVGRLERYQYEAATNAERAVPTEQITYATRTTIIGQIIAAFSSKLSDAKLSLRGAHRPADCPQVGSERRDLGSNSTT